MAKKNSYLIAKGGKSKEPEYVMVDGYVVEHMGFLYGVHKEAKNRWIVTELSTGMWFCGRKTKAACLEDFPTFYPSVRIAWKAHYKAGSVYRCYKEYSKQYNLGITELSEVYFAINGTYVGERDWKVKPRD